MRESSANNAYPWEAVPTPRPALIESEEPQPDANDVEKLACQEIWRFFDSRKLAGGSLEPLSLEWFKHIETKRYRRHGRWIADFFDFSRHFGESIIAIGDGLGTEWALFAEKGSNVTICDSSSEKLNLYRQHFQSRGISGQFVHTSMDHLPSGDDRVDVVSLFFHQTPDIAIPTLLDEAQRILRPGGKIVAALPARFNSFKWKNLLLPWRRWFGKKDHDSKQRFTAQELRVLFSRFDNLRIFKRHLRRSELPYLWRWFPLPILEKIMGRFLVVSAFKPLSTVEQIRIAA